VFFILANFSWSSQFWKVKVKTSGFSFLPTFFVQFVVLLFQKIEARFSNWSLNEACCQAAEKQENVKMEKDERWLDTSGQILT